VIAGPTNAGKSSLFNALLGRARAIVTEIPGTTRDALEAVIDSGKWPLRLVDTAGLRETEDRIERLGIEVSQRYLSSADVVLACAETSSSLEETISVVSRASTGSVVPVFTKTDLVSMRDERRSPGAIPVSAETGAGLQELLRSINETLDARHGEIVPDLPILTRVRHRRALDIAHSEIEQFRSGWRENKLPVTVIAVHLRTAVHALEELIGVVEIEDVLDRVFSSFCVGK
jgi:tRNA modification GTPase